MSATIDQFNAALDKWVGYNGAGTLDNPDTPFGAWFGINGPGAGGQWCDMLLDYCANQVGLELLPPPKGSAGVFTTWNAYAAAGRTHSTPQRGDLIVFTFSHIGFVESVAGNTLTTIQGNTIGDVAGSTRYGNTCRRKTVVLPNSTVKGFCRPSYAAASNTPATTDESDLEAWMASNADTVKSLIEQALEEKLPGLVRDEIKRGMGNDYANKDPKTVIAAGPQSNRSATKVRDMKDGGTGAIAAHVLTQGTKLQAIMDHFEIELPESSK